MRRVVISPTISRRIGACGLTHIGVAEVLDRLHTDLKYTYPENHDYRDEDDPRVFHYLIIFKDADMVHDFNFLIDDSTSPDHLFIEDFYYTSSSI